jgi:hypothetical protein
MLRFSGSSTIAIHISIGRCSGWTSRFPQLVDRVSKETNGAGARGTFFAESGSVLGRVEPAFEDTMAVWAGISTFALRFAEVGAR